MKETDISNNLEERPLTSDEFKRMEDREQRQKELEKEREHSLDFWGYEFIKNRDKLKLDIGKEVYFALNYDVHKGIITKINPSGMCHVEFLPKDGILDELGQYHTMQYGVMLHFSNLYPNVRYALLDAEYNKLSNNGNVDVLSKKVTQPSNEEYITIKSKDMEVLKRIQDKISETMMDENESQGITTNMSYNLQKWFLEDYTEPAENPFNN